MEERAEEGLDRESNQSVREHASMTRGEQHGISRKRRDYASDLHIERGEYASSTEKKQQRKETEKGGHENTGATIILTVITPEDAVCVKAAGNALSGTRAVKVVLRLLIAGSPEIVRIGLQSEGRDELRLNITQTILSSQGITDF